MTETAIRESSIAAQGTVDQRTTEPWARVAADAYAEMALLRSGNDDPDHRAKVREAHERALERGSDLL